MDTVIDLSDGCQRAVAARNALGVTQADIATILGVHSVTVSRWENGHDDPSAYMLALLDRFEVAGRKSGVGSGVKRVLAGRGPIAALYYLLASSYENPPSRLAEES